MRLFAFAALTALLAGACSKATQSTTAPSATTSSPTTETFASLLTAGGTASRAFTAAQAGTINVTLTSAGPPSSIVVGLGVGIRGAGVPCSLSISTATAAGSAAQITTTADAGSYCVEIFDLGHVTGAVSFSITVDHP
jgi:hypothetical protein